MNLKTTLRGRTFQFGSLVEVMAKANEERSGDKLAGLAAIDETERLAAKWVLAEIPLGRFLEEPAVPYEEDEVTRLELDTLDREAFHPFESVTVGEFREWLLGEEATGERLAALAPGLTAEMAAAVAKLLTNKELIYVASKIRVVTRLRNTMGLPGRLGIRIQPNHPTDDPRGILAATVDGLLLGSGDAVIGINPAADSLESVVGLLHLLENFISRHEIPTQHCVLGHVTTQMEAMRRGAPVDLCFQSLAGTEAGNRAFGISLALLDEAREMTLAQKRAPGDNVMYFETGQGSELSSDAHCGVDQVTLEARCYAVARHYKPLLVNTVVGFIGPEYLYDGRQITRAGLEDHFMGKLLGLPMGCDVCYTNHARADQNDMDNLMVLLAAAGVNYFMGVPLTDDVMLNYQSTSYHDAMLVRRLLKLKPAPEFEAWLAGRGVAWDGAIEDGKSGMLGTPSALIEDLRREMSERA